MVLYQKDLTASTLATASTQEQKQMLGDRLFPLIRCICTCAERSDLVGKVTGMLLELDNQELLDMLVSWEKLISKVIIISKM